MQKLKKLAVRGMIWTLAGYGGSQVLRFGGNLLLTRLLFPEFFGLMALVNIFILGLVLFSDVGIGVSIVQNKRGDDLTFMNTAWTVQVIRGFGLWLLCWLLAYPMARFYEEPQLAWMIPIVGFTTVLAGFNSTALYTLERHLAVKQLTMMELCSQTAQLVVMITWATIHPTIWALVVGNLVAAMMKLIWSHRLLPQQRNSFAWESTAVQELFSLGRWVFLSTALTFLAEQADRLLLGKLFSLELLGIYGIALMMSDLPRQVTLSLSHRVIFPTISKLTDLPRQDLRGMVLKNRRLLLLVLTGGMVILISFGDVIIRTLYDDRYAAAAWMLPILALGIWPRLLCSTIETSLVAFGKVQYAAIGNFFRLLFTVVGIWLGFQWFGNLGAVAAVALNDLIYYLVVLYGLHQEQMGCLRQDLRATVLLLGGVGLIVLGRTLYGLELPPFGMV